MWCVFRYSQKERNTRQKGLSRASSEPQKETCLCNGMKEKKNCVHFWFDIRRRRGIGIMRGGQTLPLTACKECRYWLKWKFFDGPFNRKVSSFSPCFLFLIIKDRWCSPFSLVSVERFFFMRRVPKFADNPSSRISQKVAIRLKVKMWTGLGQVSEYS